MMGFTTTLNLVSIGVAILACIAAIASSIVAALTYRSSRSPEVITCLESDRDRGVLFLVVKNIGGGVAYDVRLDVGDLPVKADLKNSVEASFVKTGIPMLVPGAERSAMIHENSSAAREFGDQRYQASVEYYRANEKRHRCRLKVVGQFVLEYQSFAGAFYAKSDEYLSRVALERIARGIEK